MIRNERQYRTAGRQRKQLADALDELLAGQLDDSARQNNDPFPDQAALRLQLAQTSLAVQIADLDAQLGAYEALRSGGLQIVVVTSLADLPDALVRARIASGLTQRALAERLGLKEQQVQRYESEGYASASLARLQEVMRALGIQLEAGLELPPRDTPLSRLRGLCLFGQKKTRSERPMSTSPASGRALRPVGCELYFIPVQTRMPWP